MKFSDLPCLCFLWRCTFLEPHNSALLFYVLGCGTYPDTLTANKHLVGPKLMVWYCDKLCETLKTWKANSHLPSHCPPHLRANGQLLQVPNYPRLGLQDQIKFPRISQLEYFRGRKKHTPSQRQSFRNPAGTWLTRFKYDQSLVFMCVPPSVLE